jgi:hypothetical protein
MFFALLSVFPCDGTFAAFSMLPATAQVAVGRILTTFLNFVKRPHHKSCRTFEGTERPTGISSLTRTTDAHFCGNGWTRGMRTAPFFLQSAETSEFL